MSEIKQQPFYLQLIDLSIVTNIWVTLNLTAFALFISHALKGQINFLPLLSLATMVWQIYTLDRMIVHPEDQNSTKIDISQVRYIKKHGIIFKTLFGFSIILQFALILNNPRILFPIIIGITLSLMYILKVPIINKRIKSLPYTKTFFVSFTILFTILAYTYQFDLMGFSPLIFMLIFILLSLNTILCDLKDIKNDKKIGIKTFANSIPTKSLLTFIIILSTIIGMGILIFSRNTALQAIATTYFFLGVSSFHLFKNISSRYLFFIIDSLGLFLFGNYLFLTFIK